MNWNLIDPVGEYKIERLEATTVTVGSTSRIEYGNLQSFTVEATGAGLNSFTDATVDPETTYQYRTQGKGSEWGEFSSWVFSGAKDIVDLEAPSAVSLSRALDNGSVTVNWTPPEGEFTHYTVQRQEVVVQERSTFFANTVSLLGTAPGCPWTAPATPTPPSCPRRPTNTGWRWSGTTLWATTLTGYELPPST